MFFHICWISTGPTHQHTRKQYVQRIIFIQSFNLLVSFKSEGKNVWTNIKMCNAGEWICHRETGDVWCSCHAGDCPPESSVWLLSRVCFRSNWGQRTESRGERRWGGLMSLTLCQIWLNSGMLFSLASNTHASVAICVPSFVLFLSCLLTQSMLLLPFVCFPIFFFPSVSVFDLSPPFCFNLTLFCLLTLPPPQFSFYLSPSTCVYFIVSPLLIWSLYRVTFWWDSYWSSTMQCVDFTFTADESIGWNPMQVLPTSESA